MTRGVLVMVLMAVGWLSLVGPSLAARYPENPVVTGASLFASHEGVGRFALKDETSVWWALAGEQTFEPVLAGCRLLIGTSAGLVALDAADGALRWRRFADTTVFSPTLVGDRAYAAGRDGVLRALESATGEVRWARRFEGWVYPPAKQAGVLVTGGQGAVLTGLEPETGTVRWRRALSQELVYRPVAGHNAVFVTTFAGEVLAIDAASGAVRWRRQLPVAASSPRVWGSRLYLLRLDGVLQVLDQASGEGLAQRALGDDVSAIRLDGGRVVVTASGGGVAVLDADDLGSLWEGRWSPPLRVAARLRGERLLAVSGPAPRLESRVLLVAPSAPRLATTPGGTCPGD